MGFPRAFAFRALSLAVLLCLLIAFFSPGRRTLPTNIPPYAGPDAPKGPLQGFEPSDDRSHEELLVDTSPYAPPQRTSTWESSTTNASAPPIPTGSLAPHFSTANFTRALVLARVRSQEVDWVEKELGDDPLLVPFIYTVDDPHSELTVPKNKGHESMVYLTYIIDNYDYLPDISMFMHAHQIAWHNNEILDYNAANMIRRLSSPTVIREGYMSMRCQWHPGCPWHIWPGDTSDSINVPEQLVIVDAWHQLFPGEKVPYSLAHPCCAQFAVSRERIQSVSKERYMRFRKWILETELEDRISGRVWEYVWHVLYTDKGEVCPLEHACYCESYGVCFGSKNAYEAWFQKRSMLGTLEDQKKQLEEDEAGNKKEDISEADRKLLQGIDKRIIKMRDEVDKEKQQAFIRGNDPEERAKELGAAYKPGSAF